MVQTRRRRRVAHLRPARAHARHQHPGRLAVVELHDRQPAVPLPRRRRPASPTRSAADRSLIPAAVEESLRLRGAGDVPVPHGARGHDARRLPDPHGRPHHDGHRRREPRRDASTPTPTSSASTGRASPSTSRSAPGPHLCLGNHLTRMVGKVVLEEVLDRVRARRSSGWPTATSGSASTTCMEYGPETARRRRCRVRRRAMDHMLARPGLDFGLPTQNGPAMRSFYGEGPSD